MADRVERTARRDAARDRVAALTAGVAIGATALAGIIGVVVAGTGSTAGSPTSVVSTDTVPTDAGSEGSGSTSSDDGLSAPDTAPRRGSGGSDTGSGGS